MMRAAKHPPIGLECTRIREGRASGGGGQGLEAPVPRTPGSAGGLLEEERMAQLHDSRICLAVLAQ